MKELQEFSKTYQKNMNWEIKNGSYETTKTSLLNNYMLLTTEVAEIAEELRKAFNLANTFINEGMDEEQAFEIAKDSIKKELGKELADCLAYITKFANYFNIDLEESFYAKMNEIKNRKNKDVSIIKK
ncbi:MazG nucleotide pyrophosphohydrolase domain-containing protein [Priestia megaterium]|uniref:MazG nucleotide pyrophosphohydrolase domain-containing protein n=1 Tax=Priestia megaterium TaxID=1404 RepID=UPI00234ECDA0|nr:MazG nucleotide pyrophosphohydrolase domain-containing protein [Priestia megaterium]MDC7783201.1 MazG nucleotide pyrophosphohydrolase domain-containing protein [Priestia megaterium]